MTKPDWKDAPEWAQWLAMDEDRVWWWFENKPDAKWTVWCRKGVRSQLVQAAGH